MKNWLRRIRGAIGVGLTWAAVWTGVGVTVGVVMAVLGLDPASAIVDAAAAGVILGFAAGATFSMVLAITEGRRRFDEMSLPRFAFWGALGALLLSGLFTATFTVRAAGFVLYGILPLLGAGCAAGSLALARRADDRALLEHGADVAHVGLTEKETQQLLG